MARYKITIEVEVETDGSLDAVVAGANDWLDYVGFAHGLRGDSPVLIHRTGPTVHVVELRADETRELTAEERAKILNDLAKVF